MSANKEYRIMTQNLARSLSKKKIKGVPARLCVYKETGLPHFRSAWVALMEKDSNDF